ncbi:hypothetical protein D9M71_295380 [compost metagenome]
MQHLRLAIEQPERGCVVVQQQVALGQIQLQAMDPGGQFYRLEQVRRDALEQCMMPGSRGGCADLVKRGQVNARIGLLIEPDAGDIMQAMRNKGCLIVHRIPTAEVNELGVPGTRGTRLTEDKTPSQLPRLIVADVQPPCSAKFDGRSCLAVAIVVAGIQQKNLLVTAGRDQSLQQGLPAC